MKKILLITLSMLFAFAAIAQAPAPAFIYPRPSQHAVLTQTIGVTDITVTYSRPGVKGRKIWGGLVPYGQVWRTGANEATEFAVTDDVTIDGQPLPKAVYSLHTIPGETEWTVIFNKVNNQWGSFTYDQAKDALRIKVTPRKSATFREWMAFEAPKIAPDSAEIVLGWENLEVPFTVGVNTNAIVNAKATALVGGAKSDDWRTAYNAANWAFNNKMDADANKWVDASIKAKETMQNYWLKAQLAARAGNKAEAVKLGEKAISLKGEKDSADLAKTIADTVESWKK